MEKLHGRFSQSSVEWWPWATKDGGNPESRPRYVRGRVRVGLWLGRVTTILCTLLGVCLIVTIFATSMNLVEVCTQPSTVLVSIDNQLSREQDTAGPPVTAKEHGSISILGPVIVLNLSFLLVINSNLRAGCWFVGGDAI